MAWLVIVVSNSSPLIALPRIGRLEILASFNKRILVPAEVHHEVTVDGRGLPGAEATSGGPCTHAATRSLVFLFAPICAKKREVLLRIKGLKD